MENAAAIAANGATSEHEDYDDQDDIEQDFKIEPEVIISHGNDENMPQMEDSNQNIKKENGLGEEGESNEKSTSSLKFSCECGCYFRSQAEMETHLCVYITSEVPASKTNGDKEEERTFVCVDCGKSFLRRNHLQRHEQTHSGVRPHVCPNCGAGFFRSEHLSRHMKTHAGMKLYECFLCSKRLTRPEHLLRHLKIHDRVGTRPCHLCGEVLQSSKELNDHLQERHS